MKRARVYGPGCPSAPRPRRYQPAISLDGTEHAQSASGDTPLTNTSDARMKPPSRSRPHRPMLPTPRHIWASLSGAARHSAAVGGRRQPPIRVLSSSTARRTCCLLCSSSQLLLHPAMHPAPSTQAAAISHQPCTMHRMAAAPWLLSVPSVRVRVPYRYLRVQYEYVYDDYSSTSYRYRLYSCTGRPTGTVPVPVLMLAPVPVVA
eukprot:COSAG01_NODE_1065_length_11883_cov_104.177868_2_plen_205_part_00